jgi:hypothetical protein
VKEISYGKGRRKYHNKKHTPSIPVCDVQLVSSFDKTECGVPAALQHQKSKDLMRDQGTRRP